MEETSTKRHLSVPGWHLRICDDQGKLNWYVVAQVFFIRTVIALTTMHTSYHPD